MPNPLLVGMVATSSLLTPLPATEWGLPDIDRSTRDAKVAAALTAGIPLGIAAAGYSYSFVGPRSMWSPVAFAIALGAPTTLYFGYAYGGDPDRGRLVTGMWPLAAGLCGILAGTVVAATSPPRVEPGFDAFPPSFVSGLTGFAAGSLLYVGWAAWDAFKTTEHRNQKRLAAPAKPSK